MIRSRHLSTARRVLVALATAVAIPTVSAHAQFAASPVHYLRGENTFTMSIFGERRSPPSFVDWLNDGASQDVRYTLYAGQHYVFSGACDDDCTDLDFRLYDGGYNLVAQDVDPDPTPVVGVTPRRTGTFYLRVTMAACGASPCMWGVDLSRR